VSGEAQQRAYATKAKAGAAVNTGVVTGWLPAAVNEGMALWHVRHDDDDSEDLEEDEAEEAIAQWEGSEEKARYDAKAAAKAAGVSMEEDAEGEEEEEDAAWRTYVNKLAPSKERCGSEAQLGLAALRSKILELEEMCAAGIKARETAAGAEWTKGRSSARSDWRTSVAAAAAVGELGECVVTFEELLRSFQTAEDLSEGDDKRKQMAKEGWKFGVGISLDGQPDEVAPVSGAEAAGAEAAGAAEQPHPLVGRLGRRFIHGAAVDGKVVAWLPAQDQGEVALWSFVHGDGDDEDLEEVEVTEAVRAFEENDEEGEDEDEAAEEAGGSGLEDTEEEEDDEEDEEEEDETSETLWPTWGARDSWRSNVRGARTTAQLALAEEQLRYCAEKFGVADLDLRSKEAKQLDKGGGRKSIGAALQRHTQASFGYGGRAAARDASAKISQMARRAYESDEEEAPRNRRAKPKSPKKKARAGGRRR
jgi:hypothetical protein